MLAAARRRTSRASPPATDGYKTFRGIILSGPRPDINSSFNNAAWRAFVSSSIRASGSSIKFTPRHFEEKGKEREARKLHSMTLTAPCFAMSCMLNGPVIWSALASLCVIVLT